MPNYRPITDFWILARAKLKHGRRFYGAYPGGFLERARALLGVTINDPVLHVCAGRVRDYPYPRGIGPNDKTLDLDAAVEPDFVQDARRPFPLMAGEPFSWIHLTRLTMQRNMRQAVPPTRRRTN